MSAAVAHPDSRPTRLLEAVRAGEVEMVTCEQLLGEVERALAGKYFTQRVTAEERIAYLEWGNSREPQQTKRHQETGSRLVFTDTGRPAKPGRKTDRSLLVGLDRHHLVQNTVLHEVVAGA